jgi:MFS family permease
MQLDARRRWFALVVLCLGVLMIVLDSTIVNVALPSIRQDLAFDDASLVWVVNAYLLTFGGFLLLGGRLGDLYGHRRLFLAGIVLFTLASLWCGLSTSQGRCGPCCSTVDAGISTTMLAFAISLTSCQSWCSKRCERARNLGMEIPLGGKSPPGELAQRHGPADAARVELRRTGP